MNKLLMVFAVLGLLVVSSAPCPAWADQSDNALAVQKILGGRPANIGDWPWITAVLHARVADPFRAQFCGGTLISEQWVITAAHCVTGPDGAIRFTQGDLDVLIGRADLRGTGGERVPVVRVVTHPRYNSSTNESDLALLQLGRDPLDGTTWGAIPLIPPGDPGGLTNPGTPAWVAGWGELGPRRGFPSQLHEVRLPIVSQTTLILAYPPPFFIISENMIGAGPGDGTADTCQGDSGGPMIVRDASGNAFLAGVTSWGLQCGTAGSYGVYVRMANFCEWVQSVSGVGECGGGDGGGGCTVLSDQRIGGEWLLLGGLFMVWAVRRVAGLRRLRNRNGDEAVRS